LVHPGQITGILRRRGVMLLGELDTLTRAAVGAGGRADRILTGTVEIYDMLVGGLLPNPQVAFSARLLDVESGQILWISGMDRKGWDREKLFGKNRIYAPGALAEQMMQSLVAGFLED